MNNTFRLCRVFGLTIEVSPSLLILASLIMFSYYGHLAAQYKTHGSFVIVLASALFAVSLILSILLHELGHVFAGRRFGVPFKKITLHMFGGAAHMEQLPKTPKAEALMALAGPMVSLGIAGLSFVLVVLLAAVGVQPNPILQVVGSVLYLNIVFAVFNLVPMFPLDGGRIARAAAWHIKKDYLVATRLAVGIANVLSYALMGCGVAIMLGARIPFFGTGMFSGLWIAVIAWLIQTMGKQELKQVEFLIEYGRMTRWK